MRDKEYFNDGAYFFTNKIVRQKVKEHCKKNNTRFYEFVDEAAREKLQREGIEVDLKPRTLQFV